MRKRIALFLVFILLLSVIPSNNLSSASSSKTPFYDGEMPFNKDPLNGLTWSDFKIQNNVPFETPMRNTNGYYFNIEIWLDLKLAVYGSYEDAPGNSFKNATGSLDTQGKYVETPNKGYYEGGTGEYRYHGFDKNGNRFANGKFPLDAVSSRKASDKNWVYQVWDDRSPYYRDRNGNPHVRDSSDYFKLASKSTANLTPVKQLEINQTRSWINKSLPFELNKGTNTDKNAYNYVHIQSRPTSLLGGSGKMVHLDPYGVTWYQIFSLNTVKEKAMTPVEAEIEIVSKKDILHGDFTAFVEYEVKVTGTLKDEYLFDGIDDGDFSDEVLRGVYYNREDIDKWNFTVTDSVTGKEIKQQGKKIAANKGETTFFMSVPFSDYSSLVTPENPVLSISFNASATSEFFTKAKSTGYTTTGTQEQPRAMQTVPVPIWKDPNHIEITAPTEMLDTEKFKFSAKATDLAKYNYTVTLDGLVLSETDALKFINGIYLFPLVGEDKVYSYVVNFKEKTTGFEYDFVKYVIVYTTKPKAQFTVTGTFKENRLISALSSISSVNSEYLKSRSTITVTNFEVKNLSGSNTNIKYGTNNFSQIDFIVKKQAEVEIGLEATAIIKPTYIERVDIPSDYFKAKKYTYKLFTLEDYKPALISNIWNASLPRGEKLDFVYDAASVDEDIISVNTYEIRKDSNGDGTFDTQVKSGAYSSFTGFNPTALGHYKIIFYAEEIFGQPTLSQHITAADKRTMTIEREFFVDNLAPMTKLYTDIEYAFPEVDIIVLTDRSITRERNNTIVAERMNWINGLRQSGINASVQIWDLHTYVYSQSASIARNTGSSYPSATTSYSSGGYSGTLSRYNVVNNPYQVDNGSFRTVTDTISVSSRQRNSGTATYRFGASGWSVICSYECNGMTQLPGTTSYSSGGYTGTLSKTGGGQVSDTGAPSGTAPIGTTYSRSTTWEAIYTGTASRQVQVWQSNWVWYNDYTGYYSGTVYKNVKQTFTPIYRNSANKFVVYVTSDNVSDLTDYQSIVSRVTAKTILVSTETGKSKLAHNFHIPSLGVSDMISGINAVVSQENPFENKMLLTVGKTFSLQKADYDEEKDPITDMGYAYVHNPNFYNNTQGQEIGTTLTFTDTYTSTVKNSFSKVGHYEVYRKIKDNPVGNPSYSKESNVPKLDIYVHRIPIADFTLDWDYNSATGLYKTTWVDKSYDLDHQFSDAQKGIRDRKIQYRKTNGDNVWHYSIPDNLTPGTYELRYIVKDIEGAWSLEKVMTFTLAAEPPMQFLAELRGKNGETLTKFPVGKDLEWYNVWSRFPYNHRIEVSLWDGGTRVTAIPIKTVLYTEGVTATKSANDYTWNNISYSIPKGIGLQEKTYTARIEAISISNPSNRATINRSVTFVNNSPPSVEISLNKSVIYEGDNLNLRVTPNDPDREALTMNVEVRKNGVLDKQFSRAIPAPTGATYNTLSEMLYMNIPYTVGNSYEVTVTVRDAAGEITVGVNRKTVAFTVLPLGVSGAVKHTADWDLNRAKFNTNNPSKPRAANVFWSGERFVLEADTTAIIAPSTVTATSVTTRINGTTYTTALSFSAGKWRGELWNENMINRWGKTAPETLNFIFTATYSNGTIKTTTVPIIVDDTIKYWELHRKF